MQKLHLSLIMDVGISVYLQRENIQYVSFYINSNLLIILFINMKMTGIKNEKTLFYAVSYILKSVTTSWNAHPSVGAWLGASSQMKIEL